MSAFATPVPSAPGTPPPPAGLSGLVGGASSATPMGPTPQQRIADYAQQIQMLQAAMDALATDHPEASDDLNQAKNALTVSINKVATASTSPNVGSQPPTV